MIPANKQSQEVCKCVYHENVDMVLEALQNKAREKKLKTVDYQKISNADSIRKETVCDVHNEDCVWRKCEKWTPRSVEKLFPFNNMDTVIQYYQWETVIVERKDKNDLRTTKKMMKNGTIE